MTRASRIFNPPDVRMWSSRRNGNRDGNVGFGRLRLSDLRLAFVASANLAVKSLKALEFGTAFKSAATAMGASASSNGPSHSPPKIALACSARSPALRPKCVTQTLTEISPINTSTNSAPLCSPRDGNMPCWMIRVGNRVKSASPYRSSATFKAE